MKFEWGLGPNPMSIILILNFLKLKNIETGEFYILIFGIYKIHIY